MFQTTIRHFARRLAYLLSLVAVLCALAGCGDQSGNPGEPQASTSPDERASGGTTVTQQAEEPLEATDDPASREPERSTVASTTVKVTETPLDAEEELAPQGTVVTVDRVISGDELRISPAVEGKRVLRLVGIDAPETGADSQPFGEAARAQAESLVGGRKVALQFDARRTDESGRLLAYVRLPGGDSLNEFMLLAGYAQLDISPPNVKYENQLRAAQRQARDANTGIWSLPPEQRCQLTDRGNDIGGGC